MIELEVITGIEQDVAKLHGDIKEGEKTREDHKGEIHKMDKYSFMVVCNGSYTTIPERFRENILEYLRVVWNLLE